MGKNAEIAEQEKSVQVLTSLLNQRGDELEQLQDKTSAAAKAAEATRKELEEGLAALGAQCDELEAQLHEAEAREAMVCTFYRCCDFSPAPQGMCARLCTLLPRSCNGSSSF